MKNPLDYSWELSNTKTVDNLPVFWKRIVRGLLFFLAIVVPALAFVALIFAVGLFVYLFGTSLWWISVVCGLSLLIFGAYYMGKAFEEE